MRLYKYMSFDAWQMCSAEIDRDLGFQTGMSNGETCQRPRDVRTFPYGYLKNLNLHRKHSCILSRFRDIHIIQKVASGRSYREAEFPC